MKPPFLSQEEQQRTSATRLKTLTEQEDAYVWEEIHSDHIKNKHPSNKPKVIFILGQPGSGKSTKIAPIAKRMFRQDHQDFCLIDLDELKLYHPYNQQLDKRGMLARHYNARAARSWYDRLIQASIDNKLNVVHDKPAKKVVPYGFMVTDIAKKAELYKRNGYEVEVHAMAVHKDVSYQGCLMREEEVLANNLKPSNEYKPHRHISAEEHDDLYTDQSTALYELERTGCVDKIYIWNRENNEPLAVFDYQANKNGEYAAQKSFDNERNRALSAKELINMSANWGKVASLIKTRCGENSYEYCNIMPLWEKTKKKLKEATNDNSELTTQTLNIAKVKRSKSR